MPIYEYQCHSCGEPFEKFFRSMNQVSDEIVCPICQGVEVQRLMSAPAIHTGQAGRSVATETEPESSSAKPPVFGRKELEQTLETKKKLREEISASD